MEKEPTVEATRFVWCSVGRFRSELIQGSISSAPAPAPTWLQRLLRIKPKGGTLYQLDKVTLAEAERSLAAFLESPGSFKIETVGGGSIDLLASRWSQSITLDCWFFDTKRELDTALIRRADAVSLIRCIYSTESDEVVAEHVAELERRAAEQGDAADQTRVL